MSAKFDERSIWTSKGLLWTGKGILKRSKCHQIKLPYIYFTEVQILVENKKSFDLRRALTLMAEVQPIKIQSDVIDEVSMHFSLCSYTIVI